MDKQKIINSVVDQLKAGWFTPSSVSKADEADVKVKFVDVMPPYTKTTVVVTGEELARYEREAPHKIAELVRNHVRHAGRGACRHAAKRRWQAQAEKGAEIGGARCHSAGQTARAGRSRALRTVRRRADLIVRDYEAALCRCRSCSPRWCASSIRRRRSC